MKAKLAHTTELPLVSLHKAVLDMELREWWIRGSEAAWEQVPYRLEPDKETLPTLGRGAGPALGVVVMGSGGGTAFQLQGWTVEEGQSKRDQGIKGIQCHHSTDMYQASTGWGHLDKLRRKKGIRKVLFLRGSWTGGRGSWTKSKRATYCLFPIMEKSLHDGQCTRHLTCTVVFSSHMETPL